MTDRSRVAITAMTTLIFAASTYADAFGFSPPGVLQDIWSVSNLVIYVLAILGVFLVYRWWALLPAIAPVAVTVYLYNMTNYVPPWHEESIGPSSFSEQPVVYVLFVVGAIILEAAFLSIGLLLRVIWERVRSGRRGSSSPDSVYCPERPIPRAAGT